MSTCDRRGYYPAVNGLFKLKAADGDLVWECRSASQNSSLGTYYHFPVMKIGDYVVARGADNDGSKLLIAKQGGDGLESVIEAGKSPYLIAGAQPFAQDDGTDLYLSGTAVVSSSNKHVIEKYDVSGNHLGGREHTATSLVPWFDVISDSAYNLGFSSGFFSAQFKQYSQFAGGFVAQSDPYNSPAFTWNLGPLADATHYYQNTLSRILKISRETLATDSSALFGSGGVPLIGTVKDGYLATASYGAGGVALRDSATLAVVWAYPAGSYRIFTVDVCEDFVLSCQAATASFPEVNFNVKRLNIVSGTTEWSRSFRASGNIALAVNTLDTQPRAFISQDKSKVYVIGPIALTPFASLGMRLAIYCLDASDGDVLWCFACGGNDGTLAGNGGIGMSLYDDGDDLYLGTVRCLAPKQR